MRAMIKQVIGWWAVVVGMVLSLAGVARASSFVNTPPLRNAHSVGNGDQHVCRLLNMNPASQLNPIVANVKIINASGGVDCSQTINFTSIDTAAELECPGIAVRY